MAWLSDLTGLDGVAVANEVLGVLGLGTLSSFAADCAPVFGALSSSAAAVSNGLGVVTTLLKRNEIGKREIYLRPGDPTAALDAIKTLLERKAAKHGAVAGVSAAGAASKVGMFFLDGGAVSGPVVGAAESLAKLFILVGEVALDY